jgi:hypothetical protein
VAIEILDNIDLTLLDVVHVLAFNLKVAIVDSNYRFERRHSIGRGRGKGESRLQARRTESSGTKSLST